MPSSVSVCLCFCFIRACIFLPEDSQEQPFPLTWVATVNLAFPQPLLQSLCSRIPVFLRFHIPVPCERVTSSVSSSLPQAPLLVLFCVILACFLWPHFMITLSLLFSLSYQLFFFSLPSCLKLFLVLFSCLVLLPRVSHRHG